MQTAIPFAPSTPENRQKTQTIYGLIKEHKYEDAIGLLTIELGKCPRSRAALSLLGYCQYHSQNFIEAANHYEQLVRAFPTEEEYRIYYAQALLKSGLYPEATRVTSQITHPQYDRVAANLKVTIKYEQDEVHEAGAILDQCVQGAPDTLVGQGCAKFKNGDFDSAKDLFQEAMNQAGYFPLYAYNIALCYYKMEDFDQALRCIAEIIERGVREHPELSVGSKTESSDVKSVGNSEILECTQLIQAFNLKAAIEYKLNNVDAANKALIDAPPRKEEELDPISLHNGGLMNIHKDEEGGFRKLRYLIQSPHFPLETFPNLLTLSIQHELVDEAADLLAENTHLHSLLSKEMYDYLEASIMAGTDAAQGYQRFDALATKHIENLRRVTKEIQDARVKDRNHDRIRESLDNFDRTLENYMPVLMSMAKIYWDRQNWEKVEKIFQESAEFCADHDVWKLNVAHVFFMQQNKYKEALHYYQEIIKKKGSRSVLDLTAIILANLCVSYIMTSQNEEAEDMMRQIEKEEGQIWNPDQQCFHLCIVNMVIGTLYCSKGNYEFGLQRIMKSVEPYQDKLGFDTWHYVKRCFLAHLEGLVKHMTVSKDETIENILEFLENVGEVGKEIYTLPEQNPNFDKEKHNITYESRMLHYMYLRVREY